MIRWQLWQRGIHVGLRGNRATFRFGAPWFFGQQPNTQRTNPQLGSFGPRGRPRVHVGDDEHVSHGDGFINS